MGGSGRTPEQTHSFVGSAGAGVREKEERATEKQAERWAQVLLPYVAQVLPPVAAPAQAASSTAYASPSAWRHGDGVLTPGGAVQLTANAAQGPARDEPEGRVLVTVRTADAGDLSLVLERGDAGLRVVIGVESAELGQRLLPEQRALIQSLVGSGVKVQSLSIVRQAELGTVLAPVRTAQDNSSPQSSRQPGAEKHTQSSLGKTRRRTRKLDFLG